jgi:NTE family protein
MGIKQLFFGLAGLLSSITVIADYNILSFSGGGSFGAVEVGILDKLSSSNSIPKSFDLYTGISAGGLNSGFFSHFPTIDLGLPVIKNIYSGLTNSDIYSLYPKTNTSLLNTSPLELTIKKTIGKLGQSKIQTLIGTTNLNTGYLDTYYYNTLEFEDQVKLLMSTSAIPVIFPPVNWKGQLYVDGGEISNQLLEPITSNQWINVTYITTTEGLQPDYSIETFEDIIIRNAEIVFNTFDNSIFAINTNCGSNKPRGEINMYWVPSSALSKYSILNFNKGKELIEIGYSNVNSKKYNLC